MPKKRPSLLWALQTTSEEEAAKREEDKRVKEARDVANSLGMDFLTIWGLLDDYKSDWAFVMQAAALIETGLNSVLGRALQIKGNDKNAELRKCIENLPLVGGRASKVQFARAAMAITPRCEDFINKLASIRNFYAHDMRNVDCAIYEVMSLKKGKTSEKEFRKALGLKSSADKFRTEPFLLRREITKTLFAHIQFWHLMY